VFDVPLPVPVSVALFVRLDLAIGAPSLDFGRAGSVPGDKLLRSFKLTPRLRTCTFPEASFMSDKQRAASVVLLASPIAGLRGQWSQGLAEKFPVYEVAERSALEHSMANLKPAALLLDLALPGLGGVDGVPAIQRLSPLTSVMLLTSTPNDREGLAALKSGARAYCSSETDSALLRKAVTVVLKGEIWVARNVYAPLLEELTSLTERRHKEFPPNLDTRLDRLTPREREIAQLIGGGASNKEIAGRLNITEATVKAHLTAIFRKLGLSDRLGLALFVTEYNRVAR
jgi:two-component system, NarL family, nitrate/nitrite response regulator NarL